MFKDYLASSKQHIEQWLGEVLTSPNREFKPLYESMNYSLMQGGKRIRPILSKAVLEMLHKDPADYKEFLCAMECIHTYSLVHDDLPAMDNDDYRRGNLTNHKVYGEGMAILAGDGLLTYAFQLMTVLENHSIIAYHNTRLAKPSKIMCNGLSRQPRSARGKGQ